MNSIIMKILGKRDLGLQEVAALIDENTMYETDLYFQPISLGDSATIYRDGLVGKTNYEKYLARCPLDKMV